MRALVQECGQDVNTTNEYGISLLHRAAQRGHTETVRALVQGGANVTTADYMGRTPVEYAANNGHTETVRVMNHLLKRGFRATEPASRFRV